MKHSRSRIKQSMVVFLLSVLIPLHVYGQPEQDFFAAVLEDYPPYMYADDNKQPTGLYTAIINHIFERMGVQVEIRAVPWKRVLGYGDGGKAMMVGLYMNKKQLKIYDYSTPIFEERISIFVRKGEFFPFEKMGDLQGKVIGVPLGWSFGDAFDNAREAKVFTAVDAKTNKHNFKKLLLNRVDCILVDDLSAVLTLQDINAEGKVERLPIPATINNAYVAFSKIIKKTDFLKTFDATLSEMRSNGEYSQILDNFLQ